MNTKAYLCEFIGTFALIFVGVGSIAADHITGGAVGLTGPRLRRSRRVEEVPAT